MKLQQVLTIPVAGLAVGLMVSLFGSASVTAGEVQVGDQDPEPIRYNCDPATCHNADGDAIEIQECAKGIMPRCSSTVKTDCEYTCNASSN